MIVHGRWWQVVMAGLVMLISLLEPCPVLAARYAVVQHAAPVLNRPDFAMIFGGRSGSVLKADRCGQVRELEFIALPGTVFSIIQTVQQSGGAALQVETADYPVSAGTTLYVDSRFVEIRSDVPAPRQAALPTLAELLERLKLVRGSPYVWGGNVPGGVPELSAWFYPGISRKLTAHEQLAGLDCSGLLYYATNGATPRNTSRLVQFGEPVAIAGKGKTEIAALLRPLDLIVWNGHVLIVLDNNSVIESRLQCDKPGSGGVMVTPLVQRLAEIMATRKPADSWPSSGKQGDRFVVRRWYQGEIIKK